MVEGASPVTVSQHLSQSPGLVFVERAGQPTRPSPTCHINYHALMSRNKKCKRDSASFAA